MRLSKLEDQALHRQLKALVRTEREVLTKVLQHLCEVERRRLYSDFKRSSLFDYAVHELGYSEDQAHRRIQAMRLIKAIPEVEDKIAKGTISLTNASKAQSLFRRSEQSGSKASFSKEKKLGVIKMLENKSTRAAEKELLKLQPVDVLPQDRQRAVSEEHTELKVVLDQTTLTKLEKVRALLGPEGATMSHMELFAVMADLSIASLEGKRFGKKRTLDDSKKESLGSPKVDQPKSKQIRYIPQKVKHAVWRRDSGRCTQCESQRNVQFDHVKPVAYGGLSTVDNLRLLCFACNQRAAIKVLGMAK